LERLERENANLRAAMGWALESEEAETAGRLCWALWLFWWARGYHQEGRRWSEAALKRELPFTWRAKVLPVATTMSYAQNDYDAAEERWREGLNVSRRDGDAVAHGYSSAGLGLVRMARGDYEGAAARLGDALPLLERHGDPLVSLLRGDAARAEREIGEGLRSARIRGDTCAPTWRSITWPSWRSPRTTLRALSALSRRGYSSPNRRRTGRTWRTSWKLWLR
jgi:hypothetical protein